MEQIKPALDQFITALKETDTYRNFETQKKILSQDPELKRRLDDWRRENYRFMQEADGDRIYEESDRMAREWDEICQDERAFDYLIAEHAYYKMIQDIREYYFEAVFNDEEG